MEPTKDSLSSLDLSATGRRRTAVFVALVVVVIVVSGFVPRISAFYEAHRWLQNLVLALSGAATLFLAYLEYRHAGEAVEYLGEQTRLSEEANRLSEEANQYRNSTFQLQAQVYQLQASMEEKLTRIRLFVQVHMDKDQNPVLFVSNLSAFDLWVNETKVFVMKTTTGSSASEVLGGGTHISRGKSESGYLLWGTLLKINNNQQRPLDMNFRVEVLVTGMADDPVRFLSHNYNLKAGTGNIKVLTNLSDK
jgi:hypothetical protein